ncbi:MAG: methyltransferase [Bacteroidales bacterium]|nr:methyltransferase [Bacteroidales bacterium]
MEDSFFTFKQFRVRHRKSIMKVGTDGVLLGAYADCKDAKRVLDIGTGSGLLCLMIAQKCDALIHGIDINSEAVDIARQNVAESDWSQRIEIFDSAVQDFRPSEKYDLIVSNPPYYSTDVPAPEKGRALARHDNSLSHSQLAEAIDRLMADDGRCFVIYPTDAAEDFENHAREYGLCVRKKLLVSSRANSPHIRQILMLERQSGDVETEFLNIENDARHDFSEKYKLLTKDYYLKF